jgi:hypothetical protein
MPIRLLVDCGKIIPMTAGDPALKGRVPDDLLDQMPRDPRQGRPTIDEVESTA